MGKKYKSRIFNCPLEAHRYWQKTKIEIISIVLEDYKARGEISDRIYNGFINKINKLQYDYDNLIITTKI